MGKSSPKAPTPPDPYQTAAAQTQTNRETAMTNAAMNRINQVTPWGNLTYTQGANDAQGNPSFTQTVDLSPAQRALMESSDRISQNMANLGEQQLGRVNQAIGQGVDFNAAPQVRNTPLQYGAGSNMPMLTSAGGGDAQTSIGPLGAIQGQVAGAGPIQRGIQNNTLQTNMGQSGNVQGSIANAGQIRGDIANAGQIQRGIDSSGTQNLTRNVGGGPIQSQIDMSDVTGLVGGDALRDTMTQAQKAAYDMQKSYLDPNYSQRQEAMQNRLINQGITQNSEAWNRAMSQLGRERTFDYNNAFNNSFERGLAAQGQLYNQGLSSRQQTFGEANTRGGFANAAQSQGFGQNMQNAQLNNASAAQLAQQRLAEQAAANAAQAQQFGQNTNQTVLSNAAQAQQYGQNANDATFANSAQQQQFAQQMGRMQAENAARGQEFSQGLQVGQFGNQAQQQQFGQNLAGMEAGNAAQQQGYAQQLGQGAFTNAALAQNFDQRSANNAMNNQVSNDMFQRGLANAQLNNQASNQDFNQSTADRARVLNEMQQQQQIPLNLLNALRTGSQVTSPEFGGVPQVNMAGTDLAGMIGQNYQNQMGVYNSKMARNNAIMGGLFGLGSAAIGGI